MRCVFLFALLLLSALPRARGQGSAQQNLAAKATGQTAPVPVTLGRSAVELTGPWAFHTGDDPSWASPELDDSRWEKVDLTPPPGSDDPDSGTSGFVPGWTDLGHETHTGYAWYRLRVNVTGNTSGTRLAIKMPDAFDDAYQIFVNGTQIGEFGRFKRHGVSAFGAQPRGFPLSQALHNGPMTIAIRMWMDSTTPYLSPDAGGMHAPPMLGRAQTVANLVRLDWNDVTDEVGVGFLELLVLLLAATVAFTHFWLDRRDQAYLWLGLVALVTLLGNVAVLLSSFTTVISQKSYVILATVIVAPLRIGLWVLFWAYWFRVGPARWLQRAVWGLVLLLALGTLPLRPPLYGLYVPVGAAAFLTPFLLVVKLALAALLLWVVVKGIQREPAEGWVALPAVCLAAMANYQHELRLIHIRTAFTVIGFSISLGTASTMLSLLLVTAMLSRRFLLAQRKKVQWRWEVEQARQVQQVLIPDTMPEVPGLLIEGEYRPSREVGGDFFQLLPNPRDGSLLLVAGDVTGKGVCAGMLVALIVGVIQTAVRSDDDPQAVMNTLNYRLCDRGHASATCLILRIARDGEVRYANAGHLPPYRNGQEMTMDGALPLGVLAGLDYAEGSFRMADGDVLVLLSDGVVEAQGQDGTLFGFDRTAAMLRRPETSAAELADAAQSFGQEDDILVLRVERRAQSSVAAALASPQMLVDPAA